MNSDARTEIVEGKGHGFAKIAKKERAMKESKRTMILELGGYDAIEMAPLVLCYNCATAQFGYPKDLRSDLLNVLIELGWDFKKVQIGEAELYKWLCQECKEFFATTPLPVNDYD
jgi:hypothetical protein